MAFVHCSCLVRRQMPCRLPAAVRWLAVVVSCLLLAAAAPAGDASGAQDRDFDQTYREQLAQLAAKCDELGMTREAAESRGWFVPRDPQRYYLFVPQLEDEPAPNVDAPQLVRYWHDKFHEYRRAQAARLYELANRMARSGQAGRAYRLLHEVLHEDPGHESARRVLGYPAAAGGGQVAGHRPRARRVRAGHPILGAGRGGYWLVESEHFELATDGDSRAGVQAVEYLEHVHTVWRQLFFTFWADGGQLVRRFEGATGTWTPTEKHQVVLFRDRAQYVRQLSRYESRIEMSTGYYAQQNETSFFFAGDETVRRTWTHETTHQLFQEIARARGPVGTSANFWVVEGVALYVESLRQCAGYFTTGGLDAERLQYARYRALNEHWGRPLAQLVGMGRELFQTDEDLRRLYSQCAGLTHFLMHGREGELEQPFGLYLRAVYDGRAEHGTLTAVTGTEYAALDRQYLEFLNVTDADLAFVDSRCTKLCLGHTAVTDDGLLQLPDLDRLQWLDLSFTLASDAGLARFAECRELDQLNLEKSQVTDKGLATVGGFTKLEELDVSQTAVNDEGLAHVAGLKRLKVLWLTGTQVTDNGLRHLRGLRLLEQLDTTGSQVTAAGLAQLKQELPGLK